MKRNYTFLRSIFALIALATSHATYGHGGGGGGSGGGGGGSAPSVPNLNKAPATGAKAASHRSHAHHHHHGAMQSGNAAGQQLGLFENLKSNYDAVNRIIINTTTRNVLDKSEEIDSLLANDVIAPEGWIMLKSAMADSMENASADQQTGAEPLLDANGGASNGSGATGFDETDSVSGVSNSTSNAVAETDGDFSTYALPADTTSASSTTNQSRSAVSEPTAPAMVPTAFSGFALPNAPVDNGVSPVVGTPSVREPASVGQKNGLSSSTAASGLHSGALSASEQRTLALAQALAGKRTADLSSSSDKKAAPKKKSSFPDPIRAIFGPSKAKYAQNKTTSPLTKLTTEKSGLTIALPPLDAPVVLADEEEDESNWTLLFLMAMGFFATAAALYVAWKRPRKSTIQLMVPGNGEHFTIRAADNAGQYILDIKDARGNLVRSAGMLRPQSVARAAVLPPTLAAQLGAEGSFDRFEFTEQGEFRPTDKEEGYQIFPFVLN